MLLDYGKMDADSLLAKSEAAASERLQLRLRSGARRGEPEIMDQVRSLLSISFDYIFPAEPFECGGIGAPAVLWERRGLMPTVA